MRTAIAALVASVGAVLVAACSSSSSSEDATCCVFSSSPGAMDTACLCGGDSTSTTTDGDNVITGTFKSSSCSFTTVITEGDAGVGVTSTSQGSRVISAAQCAPPQATVSPSAAIRCCRMPVAADESSCTCSPDYTFTTSGTTESFDGAACTLSVAVGAASSTITGKPASGAQCEAP